MNKVQAVFLQQHLGVFSFLILWPGNDVHAKQVTVRALTREWYQARRLNTTDFAHYDNEAFVANVLNEVGIVHNHGSQVPPEVVQAIWAHIQVERCKSSSPEAFVNSLTTGFRSPELSWVRSNFATIPLPLVYELDDDLSHLFDGQIVTESLAARHRAGSHV